MDKNNETQAGENILLRYSWIQFTVFLFHFLVKINKSHCLATCISFLAWIGGKTLDNQNILWATKPSLLVAPEATGL